MSSLLLVVGMFLFSSSRAEATCGDYLSHGSIHSADHLMGRGEFNEEKRTRLDDGLLGDSPLQQVPQRVPCHGPHCQQGPANLPLPTPVVSIEPVDRWGWMGTVSVPVLDRISFLAHLCEPVALPMIAFRLDRPPKI